MKAMISQPMKGKTEEQIRKEREKIVDKLEGLCWVQILLLLGKPVWDAQTKKWRVLNGYQSVLGSQQNQMFFEVTFTDTPYWENFIEKELYIAIPKEQEDKTENENKGNNEKSKRTKTKDEE